MWDFAVDLLPTHGEIMVMRAKPNDKNSYCETGDLLFNYSEISLLLISLCTY